MKRLALAAFALVALAASAGAQVIPPGTNPVPSGGAYNSAPPTCVSGQACWLQVDVNGNLKTASSGTPSGTQTVGPVGKTTTEAKVTVAVTNTYQQALASSATRFGCTIQYIAVAGTKGYVFFGSSPADTTTSFQLTNGQTISCAVGGVVVATDAVQVTGTGTDIFIVSNQ